MHCTTELCLSVNRLKEEKTTNTSKERCKGTEAMLKCTYCQLLKLRTLTKEVFSVKNVMFCHIQTQVVLLPDHFLSF